VNVWLQSRPLPARGRVGLEVYRCLCIIDAGNVFISRFFFIYTVSLKEFKSNWEILKLLLWAACAFAIAIKQVL
jgi:hypothetical protein